MDALLQIEIMNQVTKAYLSNFISYAQYEWPSTLPSVMLAINHRKNLTGLSTSFPTHCNHEEPIEHLQPPSFKLSSQARKIQDLVKRIVDARQYAQAAIASAQQRMESSANKKL